MSDQDLRDKLANKFMAEKWPCNVIADNSFKAGWDAARANEYKPTLKLQDGGTYSVTCNLSGFAEKERNQLRAEVEQLNRRIKASDDNYKVWKDEADKLRTENGHYRIEMDNMTKGIPSEWAYAILQKERDQLRAEVERLTEVNAIQAEEMCRQCERADQLKAQCEKLAEALDSCLWADNHRSAVTGIARKALTEYRKSKGE